MNADEIFERLLEGLRELPTNEMYSYLSENNEAEYLGVTDKDQRIVARRYNKKGDLEDAPISFEMMQRLSQALARGEPTGIDAALEGGGSNRSVIEALVARLPNVFIVRANRRSGKKIFWSDDTVHPLGVTAELATEVVADIHKPWREEEWALAIVIYNKVVIPKGIESVPKDVASMLVECTNRNAASWNMRIGNIVATLQLKGNFTGGGNTPDKVKKWQATFEKDKVSVEAQASEAIHENDEGRRLCSLLQIPQPGTRRIKVAGNELIQWFVSSLENAGYQ